MSNSNNEQTEEKHEHEEKTCTDETCETGSCPTGASCPPQPTYESNYDNRQSNGYRGNDSRGGGGRGRGRGGYQGGRPQRDMRQQGGQYQQRDNRQQGGQYQQRDNRQQGGQFQGRQQRDNRRQYRQPYRARPFVLDFNRFTNRPEIHQRIMGNLEDRMSKGDTLDLFYWAAPPLNDFGVGETLSIRFSGETEIHQYLVMAKFLRGEITWLNDMPDNAKFDFRLKKVT